VVETTITIPVWDSEFQSQFTRTIVNQILTLTPGSFQLIVVDNASPYEGTRQFLLQAQETDLNMRVICNDKNKGYGRALNQGISLGMDEGSRYFVNLNNDIVLQGTDWLEKIIEPLRENEKRLVGARMIDFNDWTRFDGTVEPYLEGWCLAFSRRLVEELGVFDDNIFLWFEDVELSIRARRAGYEVMQCPAFEWDNRYGAPLAGPLIHMYGMTGFRKGLDFPNISATSREHVRRKWFAIDS
jgi:GT2 family glycosyltransferase